MVLVQPARWGRLGHDDPVGMGVERVDLNLASALRPVLKGSALTDASVELPEGHYAHESMKATIVPNRNMLLLSIAAAVAIGMTRWSDVVWNERSTTLGEPAPPPSATAPAPADRPQDEAGAAQEAPARKVVLPVGPAKRQRQVVMRSL